VKAALRNTLRVRVPRPALEDVGALAIVGGVLGGAALLGLLVAWYAGVGLALAALVAWGFSAVHVRRSLVDEHR
jgi:hypothetical protein